MDINSQTKISNQSNGIEILGRKIENKTGRDKIRNEMYKESLSMRSIQMIWMTINRVFETCGLGENKKGRNR